MYDISVGGCQNLGAVGKQSICLYKGNPVNLHYPLPQCLGRAQDMRINRIISSIIIQHGNSQAEGTL